MELKLKDFIIIGSMLFLFAGCVGIGHDGENGTKAEGTSVEATHPVGEGGATPNAHEVENLPAAEETGVSQETESLLTERPATHPIGTYYVSPSGSDSNDGSESKPWKTISHAVSVLVPGDILIIKRGNYNEAVDISVSGTEANPIKIRGENGATINGDGIERDGVVLRPGASYIEISGISITNFRNGWGLALYGRNKGITIQDVEVSQCDTGIHMTAGYSGQEPMFGEVSDVYLKNVYLHHNNVGGMDCTPGPCRKILVKDSRSEYNGADAGFGADGFAIEVGNDIIMVNLTARNNGGDGIDVGSRSPLFYNTTANVSVEGCTVYGNNLNGLKLWNGGRVVNTVVHSSGLAGLVFVYNGKYSIINSLIANNGIAARDYGMVVGYDEPEPLGRNDNIELYIFNTVFYKNGPESEPTGNYLGRGVTLHSDYNCWFSRSDEEIYYAKDDHSYSSGEAIGNNDLNSVYTDPKLGEDHLPQSGSPLIDGGTAIFKGIYAPSTDINGRGRNTPDIGPYEVE